MLAYDLGGFELRSAFPLPGLRAVVRATQVPIIVLDVSDAPAPASGSVVFRWPGRYGLTLSALESGWLLSSAAHGSVVISADGRSVMCYPRAASSDWPDVLVRRILPRLVQWHGRIALHAASVSDGCSATILLGPSRTGKSTLAAALRRHAGWRVLSDDIAIVDGDAAPPLALPTVTGLCLWPDSLSAFVPALSECRIVAGHDEKRWLDESADDPEPPRPVAAILIVSAPHVADRGPDAIALRRVAPRDAVMHAGAQMMCFNPSDATLFARSWAAVGRLVAAVPTFSLSYPRGYERLSDVAAKLASQLHAAALVTV